jgi:hypothetical protein
MTTTTASVQRQCAEALVRILEIPGLAEVTWQVYPARLGSELVGQIGGMPLADANAAVDAYMLALGLIPQGEQYVPGDESCASFTKVHAMGEFMGVRVRVWCAADKGVTS